jgi:hypothetical protein
MSSEAASVAQWFGAAVLIIGLIVLICALALRGNDRRRPPRDGGDVGAAGGRRRDAGPSVGGGDGGD